MDAWLAIDACAVDVRRKAAVETTDARALVAELATTAVALEARSVTEEARRAAGGASTYPRGALGDTQAKASAQQQVAFELC